MFCVPYVKWQYHKWGRCSSFQVSGLSTVTLRWMPAKSSIILIYSLYCGSEMTGNKRGEYSA